ncbi:MAG: LysR family transcriptional regulator, partial [Pseudomonadota bacterium]
AVRKHAGLAILPCFMGDNDAELVRVSEPLTQANATHFLLVHQDLRQVPAVRAMMDVVIELYEAQREHLLGRADEGAAVA